MTGHLRINYPGTIYHVTCRGNERRAIYRDDTDRHTFLIRLTHCLKEYQLLLHGDALMAPFLMLTHFREEFQNNTNARRVFEKMERGLTKD